MKWIIRIVIVLVLVVVVLGVIGYVMLDKITKRGIEKGGTYAMGVETKLDGIHIGLLSGSVSMNGLSVANPEGFKADHFMSLNEGEVNVALGSLMGDNPEVSLIRLDGINLSLEKKKGSANYQVILDHMAEKIGSGDEPAEPTEPAEDTGEGKKFVIKELVITDVNVTAEVPGGISVPVTVDEIRLTDIGSGDNEGVLIEDLTGIILTSILSAVSKQGGDILPSDITEGLKGGLASVGDLGDFEIEFSEETKQAIEDAKGKLDEAGEAVGKLGENIGGLFGGKKEKDAEEKD